MSKRNNIPYIDIINQFKSACNSSLSISTFDTGTIDFLDANAVNKDYPYIYLRPISSPGVVDKVRSLTFELYSLDVPKLSDESPVKVLSSTEQRIYELMAWFNQGQTNIQQVYDVTITDLSPVNEAFQDRVFGWVATIEVATPWQWDYCDYPRNDWPTPTPTSSPTPSPTTSPTATPTPTGPTPTPSTSPTATPTGTPTSTPTGTPFPTPPPSPTPTPTAPPAFYSFLIDEFNETGSLSDACDYSGSTDVRVYTKWFDEDQNFPDRIVGKELYTDEALATVYTGSAVFDGTVYRLGFDETEQEYSAFELEWYTGVEKNIVNTVQLCNYPDIKTLTYAPSSFSSSIMNGNVEDYAGRTLIDFGFYWGSDSGSLNNFISADYPSGSEGFSAVFEASQKAGNYTYYYRAAAKDSVSGYEFLAPEIQEMKPVFAYAWPIAWFNTSGNDLTLGAAQGYVRDNLYGIDPPATGYCGDIMVGSEFSVVKSQIPYSPDLSRFRPIEVFVGQTVYGNDQFTQTPLYDGFPDSYYVKAVNASNATLEGIGVEGLMIFKSGQEPGSPQYGYTYIVSGSTACISPISD